MNARSDPLTHDSMCAVDLHFRIHASLHFTSLHFNSTLGRVG
jgi:hypothetical protein